MPFPVLLPLAFKGLLVLGKAVLAHGAVAKVSYVLMKSVATFGLSATVGGVLTVGIVVGKVVWFKERVDHLRLAFNAIERNDVGAAITEFAYLAKSIGDTVDALPHSVHDYLVTIQAGEEKAQAVSDLINDLREDIVTKMSQIG